MEYRCSVLGCTTPSGNKVKLHEFPFDNHSLLPVWIMATNRRSNWTPTAQSRMCDRHFGVDEHEAGDRANKLKPNACPLLNAPATSAIEDNDDDMMTISDVSSTSDVHLSDIGSDDTPNTNDMNFSDDESNLILSGSDSNWNEATGLDDDFLSSLSDENESDEDIDESIFEFYNSSSSSLVPCLYSAEHLPDQSCAVTLCNEIVRSQFDNLFFVDFPLNNPVLCDTWWKTCGRSGEIDPSLKICSIHFYSSDFKVVAKKYNNQLYRQYVLKNKNTVPSLYLLLHEYTKFSKKRKKCADSNSKSKIKKCAIQNCDKTFLKNQTTTLFFKFPLENKSLVKKWLDNIGLPNWQPSENDVLCSEHFESYHIIKMNNGYRLDDGAIPTIKPEKSFILNPENFHKNSDKDGQIFNKQQFENVNDDVPSASVNNENGKRKRADETIDLTNSTNDGKQQYNEAATTPSYSTNKNTNEENILDDINNSKELESKLNCTTNLVKQYLEPFEKEIVKGITQS